MTTDNPCPMTDAAEQAGTLRVNVCPECLTADGVLCRNKWHDQPAPSEQQAFDFRAHLQRQRDWSEKTFGPGKRTAGVCDHIRKELGEIEADPEDISEWIDVAILALDGAWRAGYQPQQIIDALVAKQTKNEGRKWPDWRTMPTDKAIEHDRSQDKPAAPVGAVTNLGEAKDMQSNPDKERRRMDDPGSATPRCDHEAYSAYEVTRDFGGNTSVMLTSTVEEIERELAEAKMQINLNYHVVACIKRNAEAAEARAAELQKQLDEAQKAMEALRDDMLNKVMAATDDQIEAAIRLEGRDPKDVAALTKQALTNALHTVEMDKLKKQLAAETKRADGAHNTAIALVCGNANLFLSERQKQCVLEMKVPQ